MKVRCAFKAGDELPKGLVGAGATAQTVFHVTYGAEYVVYAIALWNSLILYLIIDDGSRRPNWYEACTFEVVDRRIPRCWQFAHWERADEPGLRAAWGYPELVGDGGPHYIGLIEREQASLDAFSLRQQEIEAECSG